MANNNEIDITKKWLDFEKELGKKADKKLLAYLESNKKEVIERLLAGEDAASLIKDVKDEYDKLLATQKNFSLELKEAGFAKNIKELEAYKQVLEASIEAKNKLMNNPETDAEKKTLLQSEIDAMNQKIGMIDETIKKQQELKKESELVTQTMVEKWLTGLSDVFKGTKTASDLFKTILEDLLKQLATIATNSIVKSLFGEKTEDNKGWISGSNSLFKSLFDSGIGSLMGRWFGGGKASGGHVSGSTPYLVGEMGPELFIPNASGYIKTNNQTKDMLSDGAPSLQVNVINQTNSEVQSEQAGAQFDGENYVIDVVLKNARNSQNFRDALKGAVS